MISLVKKSGISPVGKISHEMQTDFEYPAGAEVFAVNGYGVEPSIIFYVPELKAQPDYYLRHCTKVQSAVLGL